jgi:DICT domain-containing protein
METDPVPGVRGYALAPDDPVAAEWIVIVIGSRYTEGLFARPSRSEHPRTFDVIVSDDRDLVLTAARQLIQRMTPRPVDSERRHQPGHDSRDPSR